jgi:colanic acid/amylovoran biosynthesis protein
MKQKLQPPKRIIISHVYSSDNKGDAALTSVLIQDIKRKFPRARIIILQLESIQKNGTFEGIPEKPSFMYYVANRYSNPLAKLWYALYMMSATLLWAACYRLTKRHLYLPRHLRAVANEYAQADLIVPVGGGYIRSRQGLVNRFNIPLLLHPLVFGWILAKPTVLYSQSVGPFQTKLEKLMVAFVLRRMTLILVREDTSMSLLESLGVDRNVMRAIDSGFLLASSRSLNLREHYHIPAQELLLGVTVRSWLSSTAQEAYEQAVARALDNVIKTSNIHVIFIPQVTAIKGDDDRIASRRVQNLMKYKISTTLIEDTGDHYHIKALYNDLDLLLGTRFHSVIFSLTSYVPVVAIEYEHKTSGIMRDLQLERWVIKIEDVTAPKLTHALNDLLSQRDEYGRILHQRLPAYLKQAQQTAEFMAKSYDEASRTTELQVVAE